MTNVVNIAVIGGDAIVGTHYNLKTTQLTYNSATQGNKIIQLEVLGNEEEDGDRSLILELTVKGDAEITRKTITITIRDNDLKSSIRSVLGKHDLMMYPNPTTESAKVISNRKMQRIQVLDSKGSKVQSYTNCGFEQEIEVGRWNKGVYLIQITTTKGTFVNKLVVQ